MATENLEGTVRTPRVGQIVYNDGEGGVVVATYPAITKGPVGAHPLVLFRDAWGQIRNAYATDLEWDEQESGAEEVNATERYAAVRAGIIAAIGDRVTDNPLSDQSSDLEIIASIRELAEYEREGDDILARWDSFRDEAVPLLGISGPGEVCGQILDAIKALQKKANASGAAVRVTGGRIDILKTLELLHQLLWDAVDLRNRDDSEASLYLGSAFFPEYDEMLAKHFHEGLETALSSLLRLIDSAIMPAVADVREGKRRGPIFSTEPHAAGAAAKV